MSGLVTTRLSRAMRLYQLIPIAYSAGYIIVLIRREGLDVLDVLWYIFFGGDKIRGSGSCSAILAPSLFFIEKLPRRFDVLTGMLHGLHTNIRLPLSNHSVMYKSVLNTPSVLMLSISGWTRHHTRKLKWDSLSTMKYSGQRVYSIQYKEGHHRTG